MKLLGYTTKVIKYLVSTAENYVPTISANSIEEYAENNHFSVSWFIRNFKQHTGFTPMQYILAQRIYNAEILLQNPSHNLTEIASMIGYDNPLYFSRIFKKAKGISPSEYRKNIN